MDKGKSEQQQPPLPRVQPYESHMAGHSHHQHQQPPPQKCPRCDSPNTKFCYYNNYSLSQPRYFCKACRRYWTQGGTLRNVPVGGGCRKSKRPKPSSSSSSSGGETARTQSPSPAIPSQNFTSMISGQPSTTLPPATPSMGNSFYGGRGFFSPLAATQSAPAGAGQGAAENLGGVGNSEYGANMTLLQGIYLTSLKAQAPHHLQAQDEFLPSQQSFNIIPPRAVDSWTQSFTNRDAASSATVSPSFWSGATATAGDDQAGSSFNPNQWSDNHPGFHPSQ